jgi:hypothetical protein
MAQAQTDQPVTRLQEIIRDEGRKQTWLADRVTEILGRPVGNDTINRIVKGWHAPDDMKAAIAEALDREVEDVFPSKVATT